MKNDYNKISYTAVFCAKSLADDTQIPYTKQIYKELLKYKNEFIKDGKNLVNSLIRKIFYLYPSFSAMTTQLEGRYESINEALKKEGDPYILEIASGMSPRGLIFTKDTPNRLYIETDLEEISSIKKKIINEIKKSESRNKDEYYLLPLNVLDSEDFDKIGEIYSTSDKKKPLAIIHSGLLMYLNKDEQKTLRDNIYSVLKKYSPNGMWITTDMGFNKKSMLSKKWIVKKRMRKIEKKTGRKFSFFQNREELNKFINDGNMKLEIIKGENIVDRLSTVKKYKMNINKVKNKSYMYDAFIVKLK